MELIYELGYKTSYNYKTILGGYSKMGGIYSGANRVNSKWIMLY